jgi:molybdopterin converting factor small subunit
MLMKIRLVITGRMYHQTRDLPEEWETPAGSRVDDLLARVASHLDGPLPPSCLVVLGQRHLGNVQQHDNEELADGQELLILAPVAGG